MSAITDIVGFIEQARQDPRIGPPHISMYAAILFCWARKGFPNPVDVSAKELKPLAKITGSAQFHRYLRQLSEFGYIRYEPSNSKKVSSRVFLHEKKEDRERAP